MIEDALSSFGGTAGALMIFAIWTNRKFNSICERIAKIEGKLGINV